MLKQSHQSEVSPTREVPLPPILFDLDGTLVDSAYQHVLAWHETFTDFRMDIPNWKIHRRIGMSGSFFLPGLLREIGHPGNPAQIKRLEKRHGEYFTRKIKTIRVLPGAHELLRHLSAIGLPWTIATSGERAQMEKLVKGLGLPRSLPLVTGDDVKNAKPAPDIFLAAAQKLGVAIGDCIIVGDSPWDLLAGRRMKALGVGLLCGGYAKEELERAGAHLVYDDPAELLENLAELGINESN
jgi:haloacid dehalogenase superfamily, subfamily IA, variant 3 with third motif having DD or ED/haloacid dehalogenase superfamily, subfamily IA, variant 1 with third motif having Dx(3-4)D or Dx(3-4)E